MKARIAAASLGLLFAVAYASPGGVAHFAETKAKGVVLYITGNGPTDTVYVTKRDEPAGK
jgi:hypothetical protein